MLSQTTDVALQTETISPNRNLKQEMMCSSIKHQTQVFQLHSRSNIKRVDNEHNSLPFKVAHT